MNNFIFDHIEEKPPDTLVTKDTIENEQVFRIIKCPLKTILKNLDIIQPIIEKTVIEINQFVILGYQFIRLYLLDKFNKNQELPTINKQFILDVLKVIGISETNRGKQKTESKIKNKDSKDDIRLFYTNTFFNLTDTIPSYTNKTHIIEQTSLEMLRCIETNISTHFIKYLFKYINCLFKIPKSIIIKQEKDKVKRKEMYKELNEEIRNLKSDLINNKIEDSKEEYHQWINENKQFLYPSKISKSVSYDIKINPLKYMKYAIYINSKIEELGRKAYQIIPQRNNIVPKSIILNSPAIVDMIDDKKQKIFNYNKSELVLHAKKYQSHIWSKILKLEKRSIFYNKNYIFYNQIITDGFSCSLLFILKKYKNKVFGDKIPKYKEVIEFPKLEELSKEKCDEYLTDKYKIISCDPGVIRPITLIDENNNFYKYSACRRRIETYTKRSRYIINQEKIKHNIISIETELSNFNSRTLKMDEYKKFIINKNKINTKLGSFYQNKLFRKLAFRRFVRTKQSEINLLNEIQNKYLTNEDKVNCKKILILHGDWSRSTAMKGTLPTPHIGIKKLLASRFDIIDVNEFNTSKLYNKTLKEMDNVKIRKKKHVKHLHEILTPKEKTEKCIFVNRDVNACKNILTIGKTFLSNQTRPIEFKRKPKVKKVKQIIV
jgi:hypothetical protein